MDGRELSVERLCAALRRMTGQTGATLARSILDRMIAAELVSVALAARGVVVSDTDVAAELARLPAEATKPETLAAQGIDLELLRSELRERLERRRLVDTLGDLAISEGDVDAELATMSAARAAVMVDGWLLRVAPNAAAARQASAKQQIEAASAALRKGTEPAGLEKLAPMRVDHGGAEPELEARVFAPGAGAGWQRPVRTRAGWVIARVVGPADAAAAPSRDEARRAALARQRVREEQRLVQALRARAEVQEHVRLSP